MSRAILALFCLAIASTPALAKKHAPPGFTNPTPDSTSHFGAEVKRLANGNVVVTDPTLTVSGHLRAGAVHLFNGKTRKVISTLTGTADDEMVGGGGIGVLANGNFVVFSNYGAVDASHKGMGATFVDGTHGLSGSPTADNTLFQNAGSPPADLVPCITGQPALPLATCQGILRNILTTDPNASPLNASGSHFAPFGLPPIPVEALYFVPLSTGGYLILSPGSGDGGAVSFGSGTTGVAGPISATNSLVGAMHDFIGSPTGLLSGFGRQVTVLANGSFLSRSYQGVLTFGDGTTGITGTADATNSTMGSGTALTNGNYVVSNAVGATFVPGNTGFSGTADATNTLVGGGLVKPLANGNYVVITPSFNGGAGAVTFGDGTHGVVGPISSSNSLVGASPTDMIGSGGVEALPDGNYVVRSPAFGGGLGAATFGSGTTGVTGTVSAINSLVGASAGDTVSSGGVTGLANHKFVVASPAFGVGIGATTLVDPASPGAIVSATNSLVGAQAGDAVGSGGVAALAKGDYVVASPSWANGGSAGAGAATFGSGATGVTGAVSAANSLVGNHANDHVGDGVLHQEFIGAPDVRDLTKFVDTKGVIALARGGYVVMSPDFDGGLGAATFGGAKGGIVGTISALNSLVGSQTGDHVSGGGVAALPNGNFVVMSPLWSNGATSTVGAVTFGNRKKGVKGVVSAGNSLVGATAGDAIGFTGFNFLQGVPGHPTLTSPAIFQTLFAQGGGSGNALTDLTQFGIGGGPSMLPGAVIVLPSSRYVVPSPFFGGEVGAVTVGSGGRGVKGVVSAKNSQIGSVPKEYFGLTIASPAGKQPMVAGGLTEFAQQASPVLLVKKAR